MALHIVQGGIDNGDVQLLQRAARLKRDIPRWTVPKSVMPGDDVVVYVMSLGFVATATIASLPKPRRDWPNRYGAGLRSVSLITPAISIVAIKSKLPKLKWAIYPRSITTPFAAMAKQITALIAQRRTTRTPDLDPTALESASIDELRAVALLSMRPAASKTERTIIHRARSHAIRLYVLRRANAHCEGCAEPAPFRRSDGSAYLEPHHTTRLADDGPDHPARVIALCPNCHRKSHYAQDAKQYNSLLKKKAAWLEAREQR